MYDAPGIGLAAIQLGEPLQVITVDVSPRAEMEDEDGEPVEAKEPEKKPLFLINPEIVWQSDTSNIYEEGCLSIPEYYAEVERPEICRVNYLDRDGKEQELEADGILATCIQHEIEHLHGVLFIDHISRLKRDMVIKKFTKSAKQDGRKFIG
jgi:peptide deformylase